MITTYNEQRRILMKKTDYEQTKALRAFAFFSSLVLILTLASAFLPVHGEEEIYDQVLRLHVIANSDTDEDQALKLKVRDAVINAIKPIVKDCDSISAVREAVNGQLDTIRLAALEVVHSNGYGYDVEVVLGRESYPTREYADVCFPSGDYLSLRVRIGQAEGKNWWCVLFPPLCLESASVKNDMEQNFISVGLDREQYGIITETDKVKYKARFKILELLSEVFN